MSLFNLFKYNTNNVDLAEQLFNTQVLGENIDARYKSQVNNILKQSTPKDSKYPERQQILLKVIELIGEPKTPKERFIVAKAYAWSRVQYRDKAIYYLELYLNNPLYKDAYIHHIHNYNDTEETDKLYHLNEMYDYLAKAYIGEHDLDKALNIYEYLINIFPQHPSAYCGKCECLIKQNKLEDCYTWLKSVKKSEYYKIYYKPTSLGKKIKDTWFKDTIDSLLNDTEDKINKRYIYKPRKNR